MSDELKPCPFCGGKAVLLNYGGLCTARCDGKCYVGLVGLDDSYEKSIKRWNTRVEPAENS